MPATFTTVATARTTEHQRLRSCTDGRQQLSIFRILQESLTNFMKHAKATQVEVEVIFEASGMVMRVIDNGVGFAPDQKLKLHYGLQNMRERARKIGGTVDLQSELERGTTITLQVSAPG